VKATWAVSNPQTSDPQRALSVSMNQDSSCRSRLLDCPIDNLSFEETLNRIEAFVRSGTAHRHVAINVDKVLKARSDAGLRRIIDEADLISVDGQPVVWAARLLGARIKARVAGIDLMQALVSRSERRGWRVFFLGAKEAVLDKMVALYRKQFPGLQIAGYRHGYWASADADEEKAIVEQIRTAKPDVLFIGVSSPKKEIFAYQHAQRMGVPFIMGVGGSFDVIAGVTRRAPLWMQHAGLEWFWRFLQEPRRMWRRYFIHDMKFVSLVVREIIRGRRIPS
jgi:N-acetylglucosaminyldiphosphoundecaprenol N-acetyl-beta-D-mannosaminyltransferase